MQRKVEFITTGHSHLVGNFSAGDTFTGGEAECRHFVEDAMCAKWADVQTPGQDAPSDESSFYRSRAVLDSELALLPGDQVDPDYVVRAMRAHFPDVFTDADEATVRSLVKPLPGLQSLTSDTPSAAPADAPAAAPADAPAAAPADAPAAAPADPVKTTASAARRRS